MPYCSKCGKELSENATFCANCGKTVELVPKVEPGILASWETRLVAWLIDVVIVGAALALFALPGFRLVPLDIPSSIPFVDLGPRNLIFFLYWMLMDGLYGQSLGRMIMGIKITRPDGTPIDMGQAAVESVGKAFLLLIDFLLGYFLYPNKKKRIFTYISNTIVVHK